jgi:type II secretory pathway pseudopilin PulG
MQQKQAKSFKGSHSARRQREGGYLLLAILLMMAFMVIIATYVTAPRIVQQIKRDREEEMIHRGTEYARAIKKFYKKNGRYPSTLDDLDKGQIRYLRKRYTDPLTKDGKWKLLHYGDIATLLNAAAPGTPAAALAAQGGGLTGGLSPGGAVVSGGISSRPGSFSLGNQQQPGTTTGFASSSPQGYVPQGAPGGTAGFAASSDQGNNPAGTSGGDTGNTDQSGNSNQSGLGNNQPSGFGNQPGSSPFAQNAGPGQNQQFGGGAIVGVASMDKEKTIRIYNKKKTYDEWQFIYNPMMDQQNVLLRGPYQPTTIGGAQIGTPAGQLNGQQQQNGFGQQSPFGQQPSGFGQQPSGFGQQPGGFGQQNNPQQMQPNNQFPPDQNPQ